MQRQPTAIGVERWRLQTGILGRVGSAPWLLAGAVLLGAILRLYRLDYLSLWGDEAFQVSVSRMPFGDMVKPIVEVSWQHPPLSFWIWHVWFDVFGFGSLQARLLPAAFGIMSIGMIWLLARYLYGERTGLIAALLLAVSQFAVMYSQEVRPYAQVLFFALTTTYLFIRALREESARLWWAFVASAVVMTYSHYYTGFCLLALAVFAFLYRARYRLPLWQIAAGGLAIAATHVPWLAQGVLAQALQSGAVFHTPAPWFTVDKWTFFRSLSSFNNGNLTDLLDSGPWWSYLVGAVLFTSPALVFIVRSIARNKSGEIERENAVFLALLWLVPMVAVIGLSRLAVQYDVRYVLFCIAPYYALVAAAIARSRPALIRFVWIAAVLVYSAYALRANYFVPYKEDYRDALVQVAQEDRPGDCAVFLPNGDVPQQWSIYLGGLPTPKVTTPQAVAAGQVQCQRVWSVAFRRVDQLSQLDDAAEQTLSTVMTSAQETSYFWVSVRLFVPRAASKAPQPGLAALRASPTASR